MSEETESKPKSSRKTKRALSSGQIHIYATFNNWRTGIIGIGPLLRGS